MQPSEEVPAGGRKGQAEALAHDFNNLLGVIMNYATLVARRIDDPVVAADLAEIRGAAERALSLVAELVAVVDSEPDGAG